MSDIVTTEMDRKSYADYQVAPTPMTLSDLEGYFRYLSFNIHTSESIAHKQTNKKPYVAKILTVVICLKEGLFSVTGSHK